MKKMMSLAVVLGLAIAAPVMAQAPAAPAAPAAEAKKEAPAKKEEAKKEAHEKKAEAKKEGKEKKEEAKKEGKEKKEEAKEKKAEAKHEKKEGAKEKAHEKKENQSLARTGLCCDGAGSNSGAVRRFCAHALAACAPPLRSVGCESLCRAASALAGVRDDSSAGAVWARAVRGGGAAAAASSGQGSATCEFAAIWHPAGVHVQVWLWVRPCLWRLRLCWPVAARPLAGRPATWNSPTRTRMASSPVQMPMRGRLTPTR